MDARTMQYGNLTGGIVLHKKRQIDTVYAIVVILVTNDGTVTVVNTPRMKMLTRILFGSSFQSQCTYVWIRYKDPQQVSTVV